MTKKEYNKEIRKINKEASTKKKELYQNYALSNNPYKIGDVISDGCRTLKIKEIKVGVYLFSSYPECIYTGIELKKDGSPKKNQSSTEMFQRDIKGV